MPHYKTASEIALRIIDLNAEWKAATKVWKEARRLNNWETVDQYQSRMRDVKSLIAVYGLRLAEMVCADAPESVAAAPAPRVSPHSLTDGELRLLRLAWSMAYFEGDDIEVTYRKGHGYYLVRNGQHFAWFRFEKVGVHWLSELNRTGRPNFANLRAGTAYQRGEFKERVS